MKHGYPVRKVLNSCIFRGNFTHRLNISSLFSIFVICSMLRLTLDCDIPVYKFEPVTS